MPNTQGRAAHSDAEACFCLGEKTEIRIGWVVGKRGGGWIAVGLQKISQKKIPKKFLNARIPFLGIVVTDTNKMAQNYSDLTALGLRGSMLESAKSIRIARLGTDVKVLHGGLMMVSTGCLPPAAYPDNA